jgi:hypothetical protein
MRNNIIIVAILFLIIGTTSLVLIPLVNAFSETIPLNSDSTRTVEVEVGDRIVGNCTFSNTPTPNGVNISTHMQSIEMMPQIKTLALKI